MTGRTIPIFDVLGWKRGFSSDRPWLFQDFDLLTYHRVSEEELDVMLADFRSGRYQFEWEEVEFSMADHNRLLQETAQEVKEIRAKQAVAQTEMIEAENESLARWREEKAKNKVDDNTIETLLAGKETPPSIFDKNEGLQYTKNRNRSKLQHNRRPRRSQRLENCRRRRTNTQSESDRRNS